MAFVQKYIIIFNFYVTKSYEKKVASKKWELKVSKGIKYFILKYNNIIANTYEV